VRDRVATIAVLASLLLQSQGADIPVHTSIPVQDALRPAEPGTVQLEGRVGEKIQLCINHRVWGLDAERLLTPLRDHKDSGSWGNWRGEYWGKWFTAAALAYAYQPTPERYAQLGKVARECAGLQEPDGYLGPYNKPHRLTSWDIWCRKYVLLGLVSAYDLTGDRAVLDAACRDADNLMEDLQRRKLKLVETGHPVLQGTAESSIIEPIALLYQRTAERRYLDFAKGIIAQWNAPYKTAPGGIHLMEKALKGEPPLRNHAYAIMSCFEGICELYRATGDRQYLEAAQHFGQSVRRYERMVNGSVSNQELFCDGARTQTELLEQPQETCATATWIKLCVQLLRLTGDPVWADELECSLYNAMLGSMTPEGEWFAYHSPLTGERMPSHMQQADIGLSCCVASGPRGLLVTPRWAVMASRQGPVVNLYAPGAATVKLADGATVRIVQETEYPVADLVRLTISPDQARRFTLSLRIPAWSRHTVLAVNGTPVPCQAGTYARLDRKWAPGDRVALTLDLAGRAVSAPSGAPQLALMRGPVLLAMDNRLTPSSDIPVRLAVDGDGHVALKPRAAKPDWAWMAFDVPFEVHPSHFFNHYQTNLVLCDFASAGNGWSETNLFRTWLPQPLFLSHAFVSNTWKTLFPHPQRCVVPAGARANTIKP
jgi:uncharacterized protein